MRLFTCLFIVLFIIVGSSCRKNKTLRTDTLTTGVASIGIDDCFLPVINEEIAVFEGLNIDADIQPVYGSEDRVIKQFLEDSLRLIIAARDLTEKEKETIRQKKLNPRSQRIAIDAIALIINKTNTDSIISLSALKKIMTGDITSWKQINPNSDLGNISVVFDNQNSSTLKYIQDSITNNIPFSKENVFALNTNKEVIDYVSEKANSIGIIGVNWVSNPHDGIDKDIKNIRLMSISKSDIATINNSFKPYSAYIKLGYYPLTRNVYVILSDFRETLPAGFVNFVLSEKGQRIIMKAGLIPAIQPSRDIQIKDSF